MIQKGGWLKCAWEEREVGAGGGKEEARPQAEGFLKLMDDPRRLPRGADNTKSIEFVFLNNKCYYSVINAIMS